MKTFIFALFSVFLVTQNANATLSVGLSKKYTRAVYNVALNGGASVSHDLDATLPAGAVITDLWVYIDTAFTDGGTSSVALECGATRNLMDWQDIAAESINDVYVVSRTGGTYTNSSTTFFADPTSATAVGIGSIPAACDVKAVVRSDAGYAPYTAGKLTALIEYFQP